ncbi:RNase adapter RapZ [Asaia sp. As-1742]|uniref:RNase adapter RapZ n=1 Tax=Asaia sp. As-1742 TaxID=2608325 RepID=UPI00351A3E6C
MSSTRRILLVTGLSGAGKSSILRILEDIGYEVTDNPPLTLLDALAARTEEPLAIGIDVRTRGFEARAVIMALAQLRTQRDLHVELLYATAETDVLLRRFTATRRRHPLDNSSEIAPGLVASIEQEIALLAPLRDEADLVIDTSDLPPHDLRRLIESRFGHQNDGDSMTVTLLSFAYPAGLPREADLVFDARFLRNPHYDPELKARTGLEAVVREYVQQDPDYLNFFSRIMGLLELVLPRFVAEGKKHATVAIGCSGGQHRSVTLVEEIAAALSRAEEIKLLSDVPIVVMHRELARQGRNSWRWVRAPQQLAIPDEQIRTEPS